jgi:hypothetical protein
VRPPFIEPAGTVRLLEVLMSRYLRFEIEAFELGRDHGMPASDMLIANRL